MMNIYDKNGSVRLQVVITSSSVYHKELMGSEYVQLDFRLAQLVRLQKGDYITTEFGNFYVVNVDRPLYDPKKGAYRYQQRFHAEWEKWRNRILYYDRQNGKEKAWKMTNTALYFMDIVASNLDDAGLGEYDVEVDPLLTEMKLIEFDATDIVSALNKIAETFETEWWVEDDTIVLARCEEGNAVQLSLADTLSRLDKDASKDRTYVTRLIAFGSTRNLPENYRASEDGDLVREGVVEKRLKLPVGTPYIDAWENMQPEDIVEGVAIFDEIYPRRTGTMTTVTTKQYTDTVEHDDGTTTETQWNAYRFKDSGITFHDSYRLEGQELRIVFQTGKLAGMDFVVEFNPDKINDETDSRAQVYEIIRNDDYGMKLPNDTLCPAGGDKYVLYGFNANLVSDQYIPAAEQELLAKATEWLAKNSEDKSVYTAQMNVVRAAGYTQGNDGELHYNSGNEIDLGIGQRVRLVDSNYFDSGYKDSRIRMFEKHLDNKFNATYTIGNESVYSKSDELQKQVDAVTYMQEAYLLSGGGGGSSLYIITSQSKMPASDFNVYSARRSDMNYLHKDKDDETVHNLALKGNTTFGTQTFNPDSSGYGYYQGQGGHFLQVENLKVLRKMEAKEVEIQEVNYVGGSIVLTPANGIKAITEVEHDTTNNRYKLYYNTVDSEGNEVKNTWQVGDLAYSERWDIKTGSSGPLENHLWWRKVVAVGDGYITVSDVSGEKLADSDVPEVGDKVVMLGNTSDTTRQNAIILSSSQQYAPYIRVYTGVHTFELPEYELQLKPGDNLLSGRVRFQDGTNGRIEEVLYKATYGKGNIVRNTAFRGDYLSRLIEDGEVVEADDTMFNPSLKYWTTSNATVQTDNLSASGVSCILASGSMAQTLLYPLVAGEKYVVTYRAKGTSLKLNVGSETARTISLTNAYKAYTEVFTIGTASDSFSITNANCTICEIQMERGEIPSTWHVSPYDNNSDLAAIQDLQYLADAMKDYTDIDGGLVLTRQIRLGEHNVNGQVEDFTEHAGANGAYASDNSVAFWGGGTLEQAIRAVSAYVNNETYQPTAQELANMAKFVVTHGGRAILNDVILRGYIYALGGVFKGELEAATGTFKGFLRSLFEHASVVETQASANKYNLSGDHCNLVVDRGNEYVLPCADAHIGKRIVLVDAVENSDSNTYVAVSTANNTGIIGFLGDDVNKSTSANPSKLMFINGTMEFICTKVGNPAVIRWVLISNQTAWSKSSDSIFKDVDARPLLCYYGLLNIEAMTDTASDTVGITEYYKRDGIRLNAMRVSMSNDDKGRCIVTVYFPVSTTWNQNAILTVMGMGYDNTSSHRATYATIETLSYGDDATLGAVINTANFSGFTNGKFFIKVEYLGE